MMNVRVSAHAISRFRERFRLHFPNSISSNRDTIVSFIKAQLQNARECIRWKQTPFWVNKYGDDTYVFTRSGIFFVCTKPQGNEVTVKTVVAWWHEEENTPLKLKQFKRTFTS